MANTIQDDLYQLFITVGGGEQRKPEPLIDASNTLAGSVSKMTSLFEDQEENRGNNRGNGVEGWTTGGGIAEAQRGVVLSLLEDRSSVTTPVPAIVTPNADRSATATISHLVPNLLGGVPVVSGIEEAASAGGGGTGSVLGSIASTIFKTGLGALPLLNGLIGLFGDGDAPAPPTLTKYAMPARLDFEAAEAEGGWSNLDYDQAGMPRAYSSRNPSIAPDSTGPAPQITVNVQAMDARSFLDRSGDIAAAVRHAMLNLNSINDVVNDL